MPDNYFNFLPILTVDENEAGGIADELRDVHSKWYEIGDGLKVPAVDLDAILNETPQPSSDESLRVKYSTVIAHTITAYHITHVPHTPFISCLHTW